MPQIVIKAPSSSKEYDQIYALNYKTCVEEIPQHAQKEDKKLIDQFHSKNQYIIALAKDQLVGMISYHMERPFSLEKKGVLLNHFFEEEKRVSEVRLLAIEPEWRHKKILPLLLKELIRQLYEKKVHYGLISATTRQMRLYQKIGFIPFGNLVGNDPAQYQPMYITFAQLSQLLQP